MITPFIVHQEVRGIAGRTVPKASEPTSSVSLSDVLLFALPIICTLGFFLAIATLFNFWEKKTVKKLPRRNFFPHTAKIESIATEAWKSLPADSAHAAPSSTTTDAARMLLPYFGLEENAPVEQVQALINNILKTYGKELNATLRSRYQAAIPKTTAEIVAHNDLLFIFLRSTNDFFLVRSFRKIEDNCPISQEQLKEASQLLKNAKSLEIRNAPCIPTRLLKHTDLKTLKLESVPCHLLLHEVLKKNRSLRILSLSYCKGVNNLGNEYFQNIEELTIRNCPLLTHLPTPMNNLKQLVVVGLNSIQNLQVVFQNSSNLAFLHVAGDQERNTLPEMSQLESLETLVVENMQKIRELPALPQSVRVIQVKNSPKFLLPEKIGNLVRKIKRDDYSQLLYHEWTHNNPD